MQKPKLTSGDGFEPNENELGGGWCLPSAPTSASSEHSETGKAPPLQNKVFVYYEIRDGGPSPSSLFPLSQLPPLLFPSLPFPQGREPGKHRAQAQSWEAQGKVDSWTELQGGGSRCQGWSSGPGQLGWLSLSLLEAAEPG